MGTVWNPMMRMMPRTWLLGNGEIVREPALEETSTGRKVRLAGTTDSVYPNELDGLLLKAVQQVTDAKKTKIMLDLSNDLLPLLVSELGYDPASKAAAELHLVKDAATRGKASYCWWRFKHPTMPYEVIVEARMSNANNGSNPAAQTIVVRMFQAVHTHSTDYWACEDGKFESILGQLAPDTQDRYRWQEMIRDNPVDWPVKHLGRSHQGTPRMAAEAFLKIVRDLDAYDVIAVPHTGALTPEYLELELFDTNVTGEFIDLLKEYLDSAPSVEQAAEKYQELLDLLRSCGIVINAKTPNDFMAALVSGDQTLLNMQVTNPSEAGGGVDVDHKVSTHLPTGTFIVECTHRNQDKSKVVHDWEEAKTIAALTGEEPELLAFARLEANQRREQRTKTILKERGVR